MFGPKPPGYDKKPTATEAKLPPDKRPWTEYDENGNRQDKPSFKGCTIRSCIAAGPACCVLELQWCMGEDNDQCCDIMCRCRTERMNLFICCGPQCNEPLLPDFCGCCRRAKASGKVSAAECCSCDCLDSCCATRYAGCQWCIFHCTCVRCCFCCVPNCCCEEEQLYMDGDLKPIPKTAKGEEMVRT